MKMVEQFKRRILDLAIRGKLVPQDPNDESASVLLERIREERAELVKAGKIKKDKQPSRIVIGSDGAAYEKLGNGVLSHAETQRAQSGRAALVAAVEVPFEIPKGWVWCKLGDIGSWKAGATPSRKEQRYYTGGNIPWLKTGDLNDDVIATIPESITPDAVAETSVRLNPIGSVLIAMYGATIGKIGLLGIAATTNQACCACVVADGIYNKYLFYFLMARRDHFKTLGGGGTQPNISKDIIVSYPFPLPPIPEQRRIVANIEELFKIADSLGEAMDGLEVTAKRLDRKILDLAIRGKLVPQNPDDEPASELLKRMSAASHRSPYGNGKAAQARRAQRNDSLSAASTPLRDDPPPPFAIPNSWEWVRLGEISNYGQCKSIEAQAVSEDTWSLDLEDIEKDTGRLLARRTAAERKSFSSKHVFGKGMVLYSKLRTYLNKVLVADMDGICTSEIVPILTYDGLVPEYLRLVLISSYFLQYTASRGYGVKMPRVGTGDMRSALIPLPPLTEQKRIVGKVEALKSLMEPLATF